MNRIYKVIWSKAKNCYVVVSEFAKSHTKGASCNIGSRLAKGVAVLTIAAGVGLFNGSAYAANILFTDLAKGTITYDIDISKLQYREDDVLNTKGALSYTVLSLNRNGT